MQNKLDKICEACKPVCFLPQEELKYLTLERTSRSGHFICSKTNHSQMHYQCYDRKKCENYKSDIGEDSIQNLLKLRKIRQYVRECSKMGGKEVIFDEDKDEFYVK